MKVLAINGSARKDGNTAHLIEHVFSVLEGIANMKGLGENMAWLLKKLHA